MPSAQELRKRQRTTIDRTQRARQLAQQRQQEAVRKQQEDLQRRYEQAKEELSGSTYKTYGSEYEKLSEDVKKYFMQPEELRKTEGYQKYTQQQVQVAKAKAVQSAAEEYARRGGEAGANVDYIRAQYGEEVYREAKALVEGHKQRSVGETRTGVEAYIRELAPTTQEGITSSIVVTQSPLTAYKNTLTGDVQYISADPSLMASKGYVQIPVTSTGQEISMSPSTQNERDGIFLEKAPSTYEGVLELKDIPTTPMGYYPSDVQRRTRTDITRQKGAQVIKNYYQNYYQNRGYTSYEARVLSEVSYLEGRIIQPEEVQESIASYEMEHIPSTFMAGMKGEKEKPITEEQFYKGVPESLRPTIEKAFPYSNQSLYFEAGLPEEKYTFKQLAEGRDYPAIVRKTFQEGGISFIGGASDILGIKGSDETKRQVGKAVGQAGLWLFFAPTFRTGTTGKAEVTLEEAGKKLSEGRFESLTKELAKYEKSVAIKKTPTKQVKYIQKLRNQIKTKEALNSFDKWVQNLIDKKVVKIPEGYVLVNGKLTQLGFGEQLTTRFSSQGLGGGNIPSINLQGRIPEMKGIGITGGITTIQKKDLSSIEKDILKSSDIKVEQLPVKKESVVFFSPSAQIPKNVLNLREKPVQIPKVKNILTEIPREIPKQKQPQALRKAQPQVQIPRQTFIQKARVTQKVIPRVKLKPKIAFFKLPKGAGLKKVPLIAKPLKKEEFKIFGRRFGKDILGAKDKTKKEAEKGLRIFLKETLGASGFIAKGKEKVGVDLGYGFRPAKKDPFRVVQKREFRLETGREVKEIQEARKRESKQLNKNLFGKPNKSKVKKIKWLK